MNGTQKINYFLLYCEWTFVFNDNFWMGSLKFNGDSLQMFIDRVRKKWFASNDLFSVSEIKGQK